MNINHNKKNKRSYNPKEITYAEKSMKDKEDNKKNKKKGK